MKILGDSIESPISIFVNIEREDIHHVEEVIFDKNNISICLNDTPLISEDDFHYIKSRIQEFMRRKYPMKSSFEI